MEKLDFYKSKNSEELLKSLQTSRNGLSEKEAILRQQKFGKNEIKSREVHWYDIFFRQFSSPFIYLLIIASLLAIYLGELFNGAMILLFVMINSILGFYQEFRSEEVLKTLRNYISSRTRVVRDGKEILIESINLVPGDIVILNPGDKIPADLRFIETADLTVDESILTGESVPVEKEVKTQNIGFLGTIVVSGRTTGVVLRIGGETSMGKISQLTLETKHKSSFEKSITRLSSFILRLVLLTLVFIFAANILIKGPQADLVRLTIFSIALAVSVIPEALPVVITFSLSHGALKLAKNKVVVKRLSAIEDLGGIEILCSDKTGTLTENKLTLDELYPKNNQLLLLYAAITSSQRLGKDKQVNSFDLAILDKLSAKERGQMRKIKKIAEIPFDPERKRNSVLIEEKGQYLLLVRGAPEEILALSTSGQKDINSWVKNKGKEGKRLIAIAIKKLAQTAEDKLVGEEKDLEFIGCLSFLDPIKPTAVASIKKAEDLGVDIKILTGDSKEVAGAVAYKVGLIKNPNQVMTGNQFFSLSEEKQSKIVEKYNVFARVTPSQKYKIIKLLQEKHEVGFLGEGINDAPALKIANVALVVDSASDIARETADIVLLHKSLQVIVEGIRLGRETFSNTNKYIKATLSSNFGNFFTVSIASLLVNYLPLLPLQILLINLLTDFPMIAVATDNIEGEELKNPKSYDIRQIVIVATILGVVSSFFDFLFFLLFSRISPAVLQTNWFIGSVLTELAFLFSIRTKLPFLKAARPSNAILLLSSFAAIVSLILPFTVFGQRIFSFIVPSFMNLATIGVIVFLYFVTTELVKLFYYRQIRFN